MTVGDIQWLIGTAVAFVIAVASIAVTAFRAVSNRLDDVVDKMRQAIKAGDDELHERINRTRQDISDGYVRRVDLESHMKRTDDTLKEMRDDQKSIIRSLAGLEAQQGRPLT